MESANAVITEENALTDTHPVADLPAIEKVEEEAPNTEMKPDEDAVASPVQSTSENGGIEQDVGVLVEPQLRGVKEIVHELNEKTEAEREALEAAREGRLQTQVELQVETTPPPKSKSEHMSTPPSTVPTETTPNSEPPTVENEPDVPTLDSESFLVPETAPAELSPQPKLLAMEHIPPAAETTPEPEPSPAVEAVAIETAPSPPPVFPVMDEVTHTSPKLQAVMTAKTVASASKAEEQLAKPFSRMSVGDELTGRGRKKATSTITSSSGEEDRGAGKRAIPTRRATIGAQPGLTTQQPFRLLSLARHEQALKEIAERERRRQEREKLEFKTFKARPMPDFNR